MMVGNQVKCQIAQVTVRGVWKKLILQMETEKFQIIIPVVWSITGQKGFQWLIWKYYFTNIYH